MIKIPQKIEYIIETLTKNGFEAYIVGGCVRDILMHRIPQDFDITTSAKPEEIIALFSRTVPTGIKHGTVTVIIDDTPIEVTTFRTDGSYKDSRHPEKVEFVSSLKEDLQRRDFTVNAMAYNYDTGLIDYFGGRNDLKNGVLRTVGVPRERFEEDALRVLRLFRFASVLEFKIEESTLSAAIEASANLQKISSERIFSELFKAVGGKKTSALSPLIKQGGLSFAGIINMPDFSIFPFLNSNKQLAFFALLYQTSPDISKTLEFLKASNDLKNYCKDMYSLINAEIPDSKIKIKQCLAKYEIEVFRDYITLVEAITKSNQSSITGMLNEIITQKEPFLISQLDINGNTLKQLGFSGEKIGEILKKLQQAVIINPSLNKKEILIKEINRISS